MAVGWRDYSRPVLTDSLWKALYEATTILIDEGLGDFADLPLGTAFADLVVAGSLPGRYLPRYDDFLPGSWSASRTVGLKLRLPGFSTRWAARGRRWRFTP